MRQFILLWFSLNLLFNLVSASRQKLLAFVTYMAFFLICLITNVQQLNKGATSQSKSMLGGRDWKYRFHQIFGKWECECLLCEQCVVSKLGALLLLQWSSTPPLYVILLGCDWLAQCTTYHIFIQVRVYSGPTIKLDKIASEWYCSLRFCPTAFCRLCCFNMPIPVLSSVV